MKFKQKSFRKIPDSLSQFGKDFLLGVKLSVLEDKQIEKIADKLSWEDGDSFLPNKIGRFSKRNADGTEIIRIILSSITAYWIEEIVEGREIKLEDKEIFKDIFTSFIKEGNNGKAKRLSVAEP